MPSPDRQIATALGWQRRKYLPSSSESCSKSYSRWDWAQPIRRSAPKCAADWSHRRHSAPANRHRRWRCFGELRITAITQRMPILAKGDHQPAIDLDRDVRLQADSLRQQIIGMAGSLPRAWLQIAIEAVTVGRQLHALNGLEVDEVIGLLKALKRQLRRTTPAVRLGSDVGQLVASVPQKSRHIGRQLLARHAVDGTVPFVTPGPRGGWNKE